MEKGTQLEENDSHIRDKGESEHEEIRQVRRKRDKPEGTSEKTRKTTRRKQSEKGGGKRTREGPRGEAKNRERRARGCPWRDPARTRGSPEVPKGEEDSLFENSSPVA